MTYIAAAILAKVSIVTVFGLFATWLMRRSRAAVRHTLLAAIFGVLLLLPIAALVARLGRHARACGCAVLIMRASTY